MLAVLSSVCWPIRAEDDRANGQIDGLLKLLGQGNSRVSYFSTSTIRELLSVSLEVPECLFSTAAKVKSEDPRGATLITIRKKYKHKCRRKNDVIQKRGRSARPSHNNKSHYS